MEAAQVDEWIKQLCDIYMMEHYSDIKKKKNLPSVTVWVDPENIMLSEISQLEKGKYYMISFTHMWNLMNKLN